MKKRFKSIMSLILTAAVLLGTIPAYELNVTAAEAERLSYTQALDKATTVNALTEGDTAELAAVNKSPEETWRPSGKALRITTGGDVRVHLTAFGDGVNAAVVEEEDVTSGDAKSLEDVTSGNAGQETMPVASANPGPADGIYEISFRTGDKLSGNVGFLTRYKDESNFAGLSIDWNIGTNVYDWACHYSTSLTTRQNPKFSNSGEMSDLKPNTDYQVKITYQGINISCQIKEQGGEYIDIGSQTLSNAAAYKGEGGLAIRLSAGSIDNKPGGNSILIDNIVQMDPNGNEIKSMNFEKGQVPAYVARANKKTDLDTGTVSVAIEDVPIADEVVGFGEETVNQFTSAAGGLFVDDAAPEVDNGVYKVKTNGTTSNYGLVFNYTGADNYAAVRFNGTNWVLEGKKEGVDITGVTLPAGIPALEADKAYELELDYSDLKAVTLKVSPAGADAAAATAVSLGDLSAAAPAKGKVGLILGAAGTLYTGAVRLDYAPMQDLQYDPGLPPVEVKEGQDSYTQAFVGGSSLECGDIKASSTTANEPPFGLDDKALSLTGNNDRRIKLTDLDGGPADGSYEFAFRTGDTVPSQVGFLARYVDEGNYIGISIDTGIWRLHASTGKTRQNTDYGTQPGALMANTTYKIIIKFVGDQVSVKMMMEGDAEYTDLGTVKLANGTYKGEGAFAVRLRDNTIILDNVMQYDTDGNLVNGLDFNKGDMPAYESRENKIDDVIDNDTSIAVAIQEGYPTGEEIPGVTPGPVSKIEQPGVYVDTTSPVAELGTMTVQLKGVGSNKYGIVFNYKDEDNYATIEFNGSKWIAGGKNDGKDVAVELPGSIPAIEAGDTRTLRLSKDEKGEFTLLISGGPETKVEDYKTYALGKLDGIYAEDGKLGVKAGEPMTLFAGPMNLVFTLKPVLWEVPTEGVVTIGSDELQAVVGDSFPHIYAYLDKDGNYKTATGLIQGEEKYGMTILTESGEQNCTTTYELTETTKDSATYKITADGDGVKAVFTVVLKVVDNTLELNVTNVEQVTGTVRTFAFEELQMVAIVGRGAGAALGFLNGWGPAKDTFIDLKSCSRDAVYEDMTYALFYDKTTGVSAAVENNAENGADKYQIKQIASFPYLSASNTAWAWQYYPNTDLTKNKPYAKVVIGGDENQDGELTWQDAGIAYRDIMIKAYGSEHTKNEWMYIAMNMSSGASQPFLRVLDEAKAISYLTDGFGMKIMNKGYQAGGHDDSHGDYDFVGEQQGGVADFNTLIDEGLKYGIKNGVHVNVTEFALDGYETKEEHLSRNNDEIVGAWGWFDKAFHMNKSIEISSDELERRFDEFEEKVPNLDFFYVDVYQSGSHYNATELMRYLNENGATVGTEALGDFNQQITFVHWNTDLYYSTGGAQSEVLKFVTYGQGDVASPDRALLGSLMPGVADWRNVNDFNDGATTFYRNNLATKYLQHFELLSWTPDVEATLSGNVRTEVREVGGKDYTHIYKDNKLLAKINTSTVDKYNAANGNPKRPADSEIFIPWSPEVEDKIYCYNDINAVQTWDVPNSWSGVTTAYLYPLTVNGRDAASVEAVEVTNGKVTLNLNLSTPYILVKEPAEQAHRYTTEGQVLTEGGKTVMLPSITEEGYEWGAGSLIKNFGFTGQNFDGWTRSSDAIAIDTTITHKGNPRVMIPESAEGSISQEIQVVPGKTYSISAWTMAEGNRSPKLKVTAGSVVEEAGVLTTNGIPVRIKPSKYTGKNYQRLKVDITIPEGVDKATITFSAEEGEKPVYVDDFRCWEWRTAPNPKEDDYYYFEDFENVDENWGPFISQVNNQPFIHLAYKNPQGGQIKYYTLDTKDENGNPDTTNLTSLKGRQKDSYGDNQGLMMRTLPSTLDFETGAQYLVEMDYATFQEELFAVDGHHIGYNYPLNESVYYMDVRSADGGLIDTHRLEPSTFTEEGFNARPSTELLSFMVDATEESGIYLELRRDLSVYQLGPDGKVDASPAFVIDNVRVTKADTTDPFTVTFKTTPADAKIEVKDAKGETVEPKDGKYELTIGSYSYTVSAEGYVPKTANFTANKNLDFIVDLDQVVYNVTFTTTPADADVKVMGEDGKVIEPKEEKSYTLAAGTYSYTASAKGYITETKEFTVSGEATVTVELKKEDVKPVTYQVTFNTTPGNAAVKVTDAQGNPVTPVSGKTYTLEAGTYSYTVTAAGYLAKTDTFTVGKDATIKVALEKEAVKPKTYLITFATTPGNASVKVTDEQGRAMTPTGGKTYALEAGSYSYEVSAEGFVTKKGDFTVSKAGSIKVTLDKVTPDTPDTPDDPDDSDDSNDGGGSGSAPEIVTDWNKVNGDVKAAGQNKQPAEAVLNVVTGNNIVVPSQVLKSLKGQSTTLALHTGQGLTFSINGGQMTDNAVKGNLDLTVRQGASAIPVTVMNEKLNGTIDNKKISMSNAGDFGMNVNMHLSFGAQNAGKYANLYRFDKQTGQLVYLGSFQITENGQSMFGIRQGGEFLATVTKERPNEKIMAGTYTVAKGDTLSRIAARHGIRLADLIAANPQIKDINKIRIGQQINIK